MTTTFRFSQTLLLFFSPLFLFVPSAYSLQFQKSKFSSGDADILYRGQAGPTVGEIEFSNNIDYLYQVGSAIYAKDMLLWDSSSGKVADFRTHFTFAIDTRGNSLYGSGLAFFLAPAGFQIPPNSGGGFLGLYNTTTGDTSTNHVVHVEFDSNFHNQDWDPPMEHVLMQNIMSFNHGISTPLLM
ncbi:hypothetical protein RIF29_36401 [Crotalaria pallida]|uniref:Legume lectin domain-containing protein n=1 Tax=Crotalaria pallida TaxID=3830 RepID=A0AAN9HUB5_CROPI